MSPAMFPPFSPKFSARLQRRIHWINLPGAILMVLLQRMPALSALFVGEEMVLTAPVGAVLKSVVATAAALGAVNSMAGATPLAPSSGTTVGVSVATGSNVSVFYTVNGTQTPPQSWSVSGNIPPGLDFSGLTDSGGPVDAEFLHLSGMPTTPGIYHVTLVAYEFSDGGGINSPSYNYTITVTGSPTSTAPSITAQPASQSVIVGNLVTFTGGASGTPAPTFQWQKDGVNIGGATGTSFTIGSVAPGDAGGYTLVATNSAGSATSNSATLAVTIPSSAPHITTQPQSQGATAGNSVTFTSDASGTPAPTFQWQKDGVNIGGATGTSFTIGSVTPGDAGGYALVATNTAGSATSNSATLTVAIASSAPNITAQPQSRVVTVGNPVTFTSGAGGIPTPTFQWQKNGVNIGNATGTSFTIASVAPGDAGSYTLVASNSAGSATSNAASLTVTAPANAITYGTNTFPASAAAGATVQFSYTVTNVGSQAWGANHYLVLRDANLAYVTATSLSGVTPNQSITVNLSFVVPATLGSYTYYVQAVESGVDFFPTRDTRSLTVVAPNVVPGFSAHPGNQTVFAGQTAQFNVTATGSPAPAYQWQRLPAGSGAWSDLGNGGTYAGVTSPTLAILGALPAMSGDQFRCVATNVVGSITSNTASLTVNVAPPAITQQPHNRTVSSGGAVTLSVAASGTWLPTYQWQRLPAGSGTWVDLADGGGFAGVTTASLTIHQFAPAMDGDQFRCIVSNVAGAVTSNPVTLTLGQTARPADFDGDGQADILFENSSTGEIGAWTMNNGAPSGWISLPTVLTQWQIKATADFTGDGQPDILFQNSATGEIGLWTMNNGAPSGWISLPTVLVQWQIKTAADFTGDGQPDILFENSSTGEVGIWTMSGSTPSGWIGLPTVSLQWQVKAAADFTGDGQPDILFQNSATGEIGIWTMSGGTTSGWIALPMVAVQWQIKTAADFNGDGQPDILFENSATGDIGAWTMNGSTPSGWLTLPNVIVDWQIVNH